MPKFPRSINNSNRQTTRSIIFIHFSLSGFNFQPFVLMSDILLASHPSQINIKCIDVLTLHFPIIPAACQNSALPVMKVWGENKLKCSCRLFYILTTQERLRSPCHPGKYHNSKYMGNSFESGQLLEIPLG